MLVTPGERSWTTVQRPRLAPDNKKAWEFSGIRSALLIPLVVPGEAWRGLLMVTFRKRLRFSGRFARAYLTVASQAALVLENLRLIEEAQVAGRRGNPPRTPAAGAGDTRHPGTGVHGHHHQPHRRRTDHRCFGDGRGLRTLPQGRQAHRGRQPGRGAQASVGPAPGVAGSLLVLRGIE